MLSQNIKFCLVVKFIFYEIIMKNFILLLLFYLISHGSKAQTNIPPGLISGTWTKSSSPYKVTGDVTIPKDSTLTIEPGTVIEFQDNYGIKVDGILKAEGKLGDSIVFKAAVNKTWAGIHFVNNLKIDTVKFDFCRIDNIGKGFKYGYVNYGICLRNSSPCKISNTSFNFTYKTITQAGFVYCKRGFLKLENISYYSNADLIESTASTFALDSAKGFEYRNLYFNQKKSAVDANGTILFYGVNSTSSSLKGLSIIKGSSISIGIAESRNFKLEDFNLNGNASILVRDSRLIKIKNCKIENSNSKSAIRTLDNCTGTIFENCEIRNCGSNTKQTGGLFYCMDLQSSGPLFKNCKIIENNWGMNVSQKYGAGTPVFLNCDISSNKYYAISIEASPIFINSNIQDNSTFYQAPYDTFKVPPYTGAVTIFTEFYPSRPYFYNCLFWGNRDSVGNRASLAFFSNNSNVRADLYNCILQGDTTTGIGGYDDITYKKFKVNPAYINYVRSSGTPPGFKDSALGDYALTNTCTNTAYAINKGLSGNLLTQYPFSMLKSQYGIDIYNSTDLAGNPRVMDDTIDIGCYESSGTKKALSLRGSYLDSTVCYGGTNTYDSRSYGTIQTYQWQKKQNNTITNVSTQNTLKLSNQRTGGIQYRLKVSNSECIPLSDSSNWFTITVNNPNEKGITKNPNKDTIQLKETMVLSTATSGYSSLLWNNNSTQSTISFKGSDLGPIGTYRYSIEAKTNNGCVETDTVYITTKANVGIDEINFKNSIKIYPNPSKDIINITSKDNESFTWEVYNTSGQLILNGNQTESINLSSMPQGIYFVRIQSNDIDETVRVSKMDN